MAVDDMPELSPRELDSQGMRSAGRSHFLFLQAFFVVGSPFG